MTGAGGRGAPGVAWRIAAPIGAVVAAFVVLVAAAVILARAGAGEATLSAVLAVGTGGLLVVFGVLLVRRLPADERADALATRGSRRGALLAGLGTGVLLVVLSGAIIAGGQALDPGVADRLQDFDRMLGEYGWQIALTLAAVVVLAPIGEELIFRALLLRGLMTRLAFWPAAAISALLFAAAHADAYVIWPRAVALTVAGVLLARIYMRRGLLAAIVAHATVNVVAAIALLTA